MSHTASWQREIENFAGVKSVFILEGNVHDLYEWEESGETSFLPLVDLLPHLLRGPRGERPYRFMFCDPLRGMTNPLADPEAATLVRAATRAAEAMRDESVALNFSAKQEPFTDNRLVHDSMLVRAALTTRLDLSQVRPRRNEGQPAEGAPAGFPLACVYNLASRLASAPADLTPEENAVFLNLFLGAQDAIRGDGSSINTLVLIVNALSELPSWFALGNAHVRTIAIPNPDRDARAAYLRTAFPDLAGESLAKTREKLIDVTDSMKLTELDELRRLYARGETEPSAVTELVDIYKYGIKENRWNAVADKLRHAPEQAIRRRVKGQDRAIDKIITVLKRSVMGFSGMQHSSGTKPKGVLFLAGPTGTGKTEVVKAVTELLFGDERSYLRFDMSEYAAENADQKLFGAPPGYVGYESGGQLTNAVKANPFSVLLFDEIEKAHPSIMDKFLQILEDGRMTDGQGATVYFSETLIFFTSNVGISEEVLDEYGRVVGRRSIVEPGEPYDSMQKKVTQAVGTHFKPEVINRIGDNIVVFDYIDPEASSLIVNAQLRKINGNIASRCGIRVHLDAECAALLEQRALEDPVREKGGRGIGNLIETAYLNPLSNFIFDGAVARGAAVRALVRDGAVAFELAPGAKGADGGAEGVAGGNDAAEVAAGANNAAGMGVAGAGGIASAGGSPLPQAGDCPTSESGAR